jgi:hypothetical protein
MIQKFDGWISFFCIFFVPLLVVIAEEYDETKIDRFEFVLYLRVGLSCSTCQALVG